MKVKVKYIDHSEQYKMVRLDDGKTIVNLGGRFLPF
jgi:hypothetical protein